MNTIKDKSYNYQFCDFLFCPKIAVIKHLTEKGAFCMEYNEVLEHFKKDIQNDPDIEIIQLKHVCITDKQKNLLANRIGRV